MADDIWGDDVLGRKKVAEELERLISLSPGVINIDAPYGFGKTFLLTRLAQQLAQRGYACIMIDAWSSDFHTDPVLAVFGEFTEQLVKLGLAPGKSKLAQSAKAVGKSLLRRGIPAAIKVGTLGAIDLKDMADEIAKGQVDAIADAAGGLGGDLVAQYSATKKSVTDFRHALGRAATRSAEKGERLVVILDELDRCRPTYALKILELVKHLFSVEGVTFILGADMRTLARAVDLTYGAGSDVAGYLGRLIDYTVRLPIHFEKAEVFIKHLVRIGGDTIPDCESFVDPLASCARVWSPSLRDQLRAFRTVGLTVRLKPYLGQKLTTLTSTLICFKLYAPETYARYIGQDLSFEELVEYFNPIASLSSRTLSEAQASRYAFSDSSMLSRISVVAKLLGLQMVDDRALRYALEGGPWAMLRPPAVAPFGNYAAQLQSWTLDLFREFKTLDDELYNPPSLRRYLDEDISVIA